MISYQNKRCYENYHASSATELLKKTILLREEFIIKKIITVLLILALCSFLIFASDGKTRIGTNAPLSSTFLPYGEDE